MFLVGVEREGVYLRECERVCVCVFMCSSERGSLCARLAECEPVCVRGRLEGKAGRPGEGRRENRWLGQVGGRLGIRSHQRGIDYLQPAEGGGGGWGGVGAR